jgi:hypothetical protein
VVLPLEMVFKVQDGIEFATKKEWRDYMVATYYSFHDLSGGSHVKQPSSINGQMFDIINCEGCELIILDSCEQVQIDNCFGCKFFIGAATNIFFRNCSQCVVYSCSKQLRIRDCSDSVFLVYTMSEIHIELSKSLRFGPFIGGYSQQLLHLQECKLVPINNLWYVVYDHNAEEGRCNWRLLNEDEFADPWYPSGLCPSVIPITLAKEVSQSASRGQVGESFTLAQMKHDHHIANKSTTTKQKSNKISFSLQPTSPSAVIPDMTSRKVDKLGIETALLVASARAKGIDVSIWLCETPHNKLIPVPDFNSRFISLGLAVGIQEDWETKRELDLATSSSSLASILTVCGEGVNESGAPLINVHNFLCLCQDTAEEYLAKAMSVEAQTSTTDLDLGYGYEDGNNDDAKSTPHESIATTKNDTPRDDMQGSKDDNNENENDYREGEGEEEEEEGMHLDIKASPEPQPRSPPNHRHHRRSLDSNDKKGGRGMRSRSAPPPSRRSAPGLSSNMHTLYIDGRNPEYSPRTSLETLITQVVRQTDLYHNIQASIYIWYIPLYS